MSTFNDDYHINNLNNGVVYLNRYILIIFYLLGNIGNILSALVFMRKSWKKNVCVLYFKVCLILNTCYLNSTIFGAIFNFGFHIYLQNSSVILCKLLYYTSFLLSTLPPTVLILASIDRLLISSQNVDTRLYSSKRLAYFSIGTSSIFWILFNTHVLIQMNIYEINPSEFSCTYNFPKWYYDFVTYSLGVINITFCLLMIILCLFAFKNVRHIRTFQHGRRTEIRAMTKKDFQLLRCLFVQDVIFIVFSTLVIIYYIYAGITKDQLRTNLELAILNFVDKLVTFLFNTSYSTSFFVFVIISKAFRCDLKRIFYKLIGKDWIATQDERNRLNCMDKDNERHENMNVVISTIRLSD
ncbi:hypothetical protein I4U23_019835 [Adineta vaga]|nr:hypothetical protein I4U23_019835 [Adineta vaga]